MLITPMTMTFFRIAAITGAHVDWPYCTSNGTSNFSHHQDKHILNHIVSRHGMGNSSIYLGRDEDQL